jgi:hypothetical protein
MPYPLTGLSDQPQHAALRNPIPVTQLRGGRATYVLSHQTFNRLRPTMFGLVSGDSVPRHTPRNWL